MVSLLFSDLTTLDTLLIILVDCVAFASLAASVLLARRGYKKWIPRKLTHVIISSLIALTLPFHSSLTGPAITILVFVVGIFGSSLFGVHLADITLHAGTREGGKQIQTLLAACLALAAYAAVFILFIGTPAIFVAAILAVSWGDAAGEAIGRPFGKHRFHIWEGRDKSIEGSTAVMLMTFVGTMFAFVLHPLSVPLLMLLTTALLVSLAVAATEAICTSWVDNFAIPLVTAFVTWLLVSPLLAPIP